MSCVKLNNSYILIRKKNTNSEWGVLYKYGLKWVKLGSDSGKNLHNKDTALKGKFL